jgi:hypothetical protein
MNKYKFFQKNYGMIVGGVGVGTGVSVGRDVFVGMGEFVGGAGVGDNVAVPVGRGVRVGRNVSVGVNVMVGVREGGSTRVGVMSASSGYNSCIAEYQFKPPVNANSEKRAPR